MSTAKDMLRLAEHLADVVDVETLRLVDESIGARIDTLDGHDMDEDAIHLRRARHLFGRALDIQASR